ncbi:MAG: flagellar protein [Firmicutes bacterium]|nr:flagellar protein [Bacillota bacterium]
MSNRIHHNPRPILPLDQRPKAPERKIRPPAGEDFKAILERVQGEIRFSHHALERLQKRDIALTANNINSLQKAMARAADKGARESLVLLDKLAFVVSIKNKTVITALDDKSMREHVFTNIDSAVIIK